MGAQRAGVPVLSGAVPPLASYFHARPESGFGLADGLRPGETTLLVPAQPGEGGTGKTQLAVGFAHAMWAAHAVDVLAWVPAGNRTAIIAGYARAAADAGLLTRDSALEATADGAARRFLDWLRGTESRWAVVLDDVRSPADLDDLWPQGAAGQVIVTSELRESELGGPGGPSAVTAHAVAGFSRRESLGYLSTRLTSFPDQRIEALDLGEDMGGLPIALAQAAAVVTATQITCRDYRAEYGRRLAAIAGTVIDGCSPHFLAAWSLAVEQAHELMPTGLSWPALVFASALDTNGIPAAVLTSPAACAYIVGQPDTGQAQQAGPGGQAVDGSQAGPGGQPTATSAGSSQAAAVSEQNLVRSAFANLERLGLVSVAATSAERTVWLPTTVRAAVRGYLAPANVEQLVAAAAAALVEAWPTPEDPDGGPQLSQALRDSAAALRSFAGDLLWQPDVHPVLLRAGDSLSEAPALTDSAIRYWQDIGATTSELLGFGHAQSVLARGRLGDACVAAGRFAEALPVFEARLADREASLGPQHPASVTARLNKARALHAAGDELAAIALYEQVLEARERMFGATDGETGAARVLLAAAYEGEGGHGESIRLYERALADAERDLGPAHPAARAARGRLAAAHLAAGRAPEAIAEYERALAETERASGPDDPATVDLRAGLADAFRAGNKAKEAIAAYQRVLSDRERLLGANHPRTIAARGDLASACRTLGRVKDAIGHCERVVADWERTAGPRHRETIAARAVLAAVYQQGRRLREAIATYEQVIADSERVLGTGDIDTLTARCNLATAYHAAGRAGDGITVLGRALADCERYLGLDHPMTKKVIDSLQAASD
jgi:tetratricopeptide (TPR) repeat protein